MRVPIAVLTLPTALCDVRFSDSSSHSIIILAVFLSTTAIVLVPCLLGLFWIKGAIDKERAAQYIDESAVDLPVTTNARAGKQFTAKVPDINELSVFNTWFNLFEKRITS